jgi:hypothetical protein
VTIGGRPPADIVVDATLVRRLLEEQHPELAALPLLEVGEGWDNRMFRLGDALAVRLPRRAASAPLIDLCDPYLPIRARGWALAFGLLDLANSGGDEAIRRLGNATIDAARDAGGELKTWLTTKYSPCRPPNSTRLPAV